MSAGCDVSVECFSQPPAGWDDYVRATPGSLHSHLSGWQDVIGGSLGHQFLFLVARGPEGTLRGLLPLVRVRSPILGHYLISLPFLNAGGPLGDPAAVASLIERAVQEAAASRADLLELRLREAASAGGLHPSDRKITVVLDLPKDPEELRQGFHHKVRSNIKKPLREGAELRFGPDQVASFHRVYARNMRDLGTPVLPRAFFERIAAVFPESAVFAALYLKGVPICGQCSFLWKDMLEMVWGSSVQEYNRYKPTSYMHWAFMELAIKRGLRVFDFGRCTPGSGTHQFKSQWGGRDVPLPWLVWSPRGVVSAPTSDQGLYALAVQVWRRLPLAVANRLGPAVARFLP